MVSAWSQTLQTRVRGGSGRISRGDTSETRNFNHVWWKPVSGLAGSRHTRDQRNKTNVPQILPPASARPVTIRAARSKRDPRRGWNVIKPREAKVGWKLGASPRMESCVHHLVAVARELRPPRFAHPLIIIRVKRLSGSSSN